MYHAFDLERALTGDLIKVPTPQMNLKGEVCFYEPNFRPVLGGGTHLWAIPLSVFIDLSHGHVCIELILVFLKRWGDEEGET